MNGKQAVLWLMLLLLPAVAGGADEIRLAQSQTVTRGAIAPTTGWALPSPGPPALPGKKIVYIAEDLRNAGVLGVGEGIREAAQAIGWEVSFLDIGARANERERIYAEALAVKPDGVILGGIDAAADAPFLARFEQAKIPVVAWHGAPSPGPIPGTPVAVNITANSLEVAKAAAHYAIADSKGTAGVVIFTDSRFAIARQKAETMAAIIQACDGCRLLEVVDIPLDRVPDQMPKATQALLDRYGKRWTCALGINDLYFDYGAATFIINGLTPSQAPVIISAGDGSASAFLRIQNNSYQRATVCEPLLFHGWQLVDELNRILSGSKPSGYANNIHMITAENIWDHSRNVALFDPENRYREFYKSTWFGQRDHL